MFCQKCGKDLPDDAGFCIQCGRQVNRQKKESVLQWTLAIVGGGLGLAAIILWAIFPANSKESREMASNEVASSPPSPSQSPFTSPSVKSSLVGPSATVKPVVQSSFEPTALRSPHREGEPKPTPTPGPVQTIIPGGPLTKGISNRVTESTNGQQRFGSIQQIIDTYVIDPGNYYKIPLRNDLHPFSRSLIGRFEAVSGNNVEVSIVDDNGLINFENGSPFKSFYFSGRITTDNVSLKLPPQQTYLILSNKYSVISKKVVKVVFTVTFRENLTTP